VAANPGAPGLAHNRGFQPSRLQVVDFEVRDWSNLRSRPCQRNSIAAPIGNFEPKKSLLRCRQRTGEGHTATNDRPLICQRGSAMATIVLLATTFTMRSAFIRSVRRVAIATIIAIPLCAVLTAGMFLVPPVVVYGSLFVGVALFGIGSDFCVQSKPIAAIGGITMFAAVLAAAIRGFLG
jgi:hypothetical protein